MTQPDVRLATVCAELIRAWHQRYGRASEFANPSDALRYRAAFDRFNDVDLRDSAWQEEIARVQQAGVFERFYGEPIPPALWIEITAAHDARGYEPPRHLGDAANCVLANLPQDEPNERVAAPDEPTSDVRRPLNTSSEEEFLREAADFYRDIVAEQDADAALGGINAVVSSSLERQSWVRRQGNDITLLSPEILGLHIVARGERPDDLVDAIRNGEIEVRNVVGRTVRSS